MVNKGWLEANYSEGGRIQTITLTEAGKKQIVEASHSWSEAQEQVKQLIEQEDLAALLTMTRSMNE